MILTTPQPDRTLPKCAARGHQRRGVLLLIVLSMLTLFMMLGTTYMVVASRARATARAFSRAAAAQQSASDAAGRRLVDDAFRILARGTTDASCQEASLRTGDDLLGDKYGKTLPGINIRGHYARIASATDVNPGLLQLTLNAAINAAPASLNGRVVTLTFPGMCLSRRILRASGSAQATTHLVIAAVSPVDGSAITTADIQRGLNATINDPNPIHLVINGREFVGDPTANRPPMTGRDSNEGYDGFAELSNVPGGVLSDPYLASLVPTDATDTPFDVYANASAPDTSIQPRVAVRKMSFFDVDDATNVPQLDNDADGIRDSRWLDVGFPVMRAEDGTTFRAQAAYLVVDLDGRLNLNAHGNPFQLDALLTSAENNPSLGWPTQGNALPGGLTDDQFNELAFGSGYGPAEVRLWDLFFPKTGFLPTYPGTGDLQDALTVAARAETFLYGCDFSSQTTVINQQRPPVAISEIAGRFGYGPALNGQFPTERPGAPGNDPLSMIRDEDRHPNHAAANGARFPKSLSDSWRVGVTPSQLDTDPDQYNSPSDLSGRMKLIGDRQPQGTGIVSKMWYAKPDTFWGGDTLDDPYEVRLAHPSAADNPFLPDELERVLRVFDWDASQLPVRVSGLLGSDAERLRLLLTTESWDTTAIVGDTWRQIEDVLTTRAFDPADLPDLLGPEVMTGRRLDLNRQIDIADGSAANRRATLCRNLYTLVWMLADDPTGAPPSAAACRAMAQWAVNVVDFRDPDSTFTQFVYDEDPSDGWTPDPQNLVVWGVERPDLVLTEALCWKNVAGDKGGVHVMLHHPWAAKALDGDNVLPNGNAFASDPRDPDAVAPELAARTQAGLLLNELNLGLLGGNDPNSPVWRLRLGTSSTAPVIRFDVVDPSAINVDPQMPQYSSDNQSAQARFMGPDGWLCVTGDRGTPAGPAVQIAQGIPQLVINTTDGLPAGPIPAVNVADGVAGVDTQVILLERLADPRQAFDTFANPYIEVDRITNVPVANRTETAPGSNVPVGAFAVSRRRLAAPSAAPFWAQSFASSVPVNFDTNNPNDDTLDLLTPPSNKKVAWLPWLNRPFISPVELTLVPSAAVDYVPAEQRYRSLLLEDYAGFTGNGWLDTLAADIGLQPEILASDLLQSTTVPSRFSDLATSVENPLLFSNSATGLDWLATGHLSGWREPGRVNLNTVTDDRVWDATVRRGARPAGQTSSTGDGLDRGEASFSIPADPTDQNAQTTPAETLLDLYGLDQGAAAVFADPSTTPGQEVASNPQFSSLTANRLANVATNRSNVFAIWVTIGFFECNQNGGFVMVPDPASPDPTNPQMMPKELGSDTGEVRRHRGFYIFDRSIPVGYVTGRDLNLEDAIRLRRIIQ